jgi:hypothetical protein
MVNPSARLGPVAIATAVAVVAACEPPPPPPVAPPVALVAPSSPAPAASAQLPGPPPAPPGAAEPRPDARLEGCSAADEAAVQTELRALGARLRAATQESAAAGLYADLALAWKRPCLVHIARIASPPAGGSLAALQRAWDAGLGGALIESAGGLTDRAARVLAIPPEVPRALDDEAKRALAPVLCGDGAPSCARSRAYVLRAEAAFAATVARDEKRPPPGEPDRCERAVDAFRDASDRPTAFEAWSSCVAQAAPRAWVYADVPLRGPERGWLVLRGRRGHYQFSDEVRAYDLATGAAYAATSSSGLVLGVGGGVDMAGTDAARAAAAEVGRVAVDQLRELAFVLLARKAVIQARVGTHRVTVPANIPFEMTPPGRPRLMSTSRSGGWRSSAQTTLGFAWVDGGKVVARGELRWPTASEVVDDHADTLVRVMEAGLVRGCAPARLPKGLAALARGGGAVSTIDADPARQGAVHDELDRALEGLAPRACPGAR